MTQPTPTPDHEYKRKKAWQAEHSREISRDNRDIGDIPVVVNPERKQAASLDFRVFSESYFAEIFDLAWSPDHLKVIGQIETAVTQGGLFATAMPRGSGKTSLAEVACIWAILFGHHPFIALIGSDEGHASQMLDSIKTDFESNELLLEDFPEAVYPIERLEGIAHRCNGQLYRGERTHIGWTAGEVVMPTIPGSKASGAVIQVAGLQGGVRGMKFKRQDGKVVRPSLVIVDDPQTDQSARSPSQCETRERILAGAVLGLAGPGKKISGIMPCTVIRQGDMADAILDRKKHPEWNGTRTKMVYSFPVAEKLWEEYARIRAESLRADHGGKEATEFYRQNREAMDAGAHVAWEARHNPDELSALQHAMNLKLRDERAFWAEYQNEPQAEAEARSDDLTPDQIMHKLNRMHRGAVPIGANRVTAMIDVQGSLLFYVVAAWEDSFTGYILDYGAFPDQHSSYFTLASAKIPLSAVIKAAGLEGQIFGGLESLTGSLLAREWTRDDGAGLKIERCFIDANWGASTDTIYQFCRQSPHSQVLMPSHGKYFGAASVPMREWQKRPGDKVGLNWKLPNVQGRRAVRYAVYDTNFWKSFIQSRFSTAMGDRGCLSLFGDKHDYHRMFADQICSEYRVRTQGRGREIDEWKLRPERPDNHFLDCLTGCAVAASIQGVVLAETADTNAAVKIKRLSFSELQQRAREQRNRPPDQPRA